MEPHEKFSQYYPYRTTNLTNNYTTHVYDIFCIHCLKTWKDELTGQPCPARVKELVNA